ncbi:MAG: peptidoglycan-binding protein [Bacteroidaceae bacterium]|nr:peptidoglycan-binding protein [Bacteroidaceae bacterium]
MFKPQLTIPDAHDGYFISKKEGGLNDSIPRPDGSKLQFANCVFYARGIFAKRYGVWIPSANAEDLTIKAALLGLTISQTPVEGALAVWAKGKQQNGKDGAGHVASVEVINDNGSIVTSESGWNANKPFWTQTRKAGPNWGQDSSYWFVGFILPPTQDIVKFGASGPAVNTMQSLLYAKGYLRGGEIDGKFGKITLGALLAFQFQNGLEVDGVCGPKTWAALKK